MESAILSIREALAAGQKARAEGLALAALDGPAEHPQVMQQVRDMFRAEGRMQLRIADVPEAWRRYGGLLARHGLLEDGMAALELALALDPANLAARVDAGTAAFSSGDLNGARAHFLAAAELDPGSAAPLASLAAIAARQSRAEEAIEHAERALGLDRSNVTAHLAWARAKLALGDARACIERCEEQLAAEGLSPQNRVALLDLRAEARDAAGEFPGAFADYRTRNDVLKGTFAPQFEGGTTEPKLAQVRRLNRFLAGHPAGQWDLPATGPDLPDDVGGLAFLVGFPRSGTTLLEKALAGLPRIASLEEVDTLAGIGDAMMANDQALARLAEPSDTQLDEARAVYWDRVRAAASGGLDGRTVLDKMPLYTVQLPVIARLFPRAKLLFAVRDPRDVVLSCFRRRFRMNAAMYEFLTIEGAATYYDEVMRFGAAMQGRFAFDRLDVVHERLVADFEGEMRCVISFLDLDWDDAVHGFAERARLRPNTPSDPQLVGGLSAAGIGQWRNYEAQLDPVMQLLEPWVRHFGY